MITRSIELSNRGDCRRLLMTFHGSVGSRPHSAPAGSAARISVVGLVKYCGQLPIKGGNQVAPPRRARHYWTSGPSCRPPIVYTRVAD
jgi:hypothetical protein